MFDADIHAIIYIVGSIVVCHYEIGPGNCLDCYCYLNLIRAEQVKCSQMVTVAPFLIIASREIVE